MKISRRDFVRTTIAGTAGFCAGVYRTRSQAGELPANLPEEDGYKLWLRYAPPGRAAENYRKAIRQIRVDGSSATSGIIREELRAAIASLLGSAIPAKEKNLAAGAIVVGTPQNSKLIRDLNWAAELS